MKTADARVVSFALMFLALFTAVPAAASEITLLYTGETHAMLYPCSCPVEADGGIARRATLIKDIRKSSSNVVLVDSGAFFAGGLLDEYTQSTELDMTRTKVSLAAMNAMKYDAAAVGDEEFNFGRQFMEDQAKGSGFPFVSANCASPHISPFVIKSFPGVKVGIIGLTPVSVRPKTGGIDISEPAAAVAMAVTKVKAAGADIVVLLSHLGEADDLELIKAIDGIDVLVIGNGRSKQEPFSKIGSTLLLRPSWQARRLGKALLKIKDRAVVDYKVEEIRLSDAIPDDAAVAALGPQCFMDSNCKKGVRKGTCQNPGTGRAKCVFPQEIKVQLAVVAPKNCPTCRIDDALQSFKKQFPGLQVSTVLYPGGAASKMIEEFGLKTLPSYIFDQALSKDPGYADMKDRFELIKGSYLLKPQFGGVALFLGRPLIEKKIDVFLSLYDPAITTLLFALEEFNPDVHFLAAHSNGQIVTAKGLPELEEIKRCVCVKKYYPAFFWNYLNCRVRNIESSWWQDCLGELDPGVIKTCAQGAEGIALLEQNIAMNEELEIISSPTYVVNNQNIFSSKQPPSKDEFRKIFSSK